MIYDPCHLLGGMSEYCWETDPKRFVFLLSRYKFVAKMLAGMERVLEVGCADGVGTRIVRQHVGRVTAVDVDHVSLEEARKKSSARWPVDFMTHDILTGPPGGPGEFDAVYCLDVFEHFSDENRLLSVLVDCAPVAIIGTPSLESQPYASELSRLGHVNCKSGEVLKAAAKRHWQHVFLFSMNDEVVHTGFSPMAHYLFILATNPI